MENSCEPQKKITYDQELVEESVQHDNEVAKVLEADSIPNVSSSSDLAVVVQEPVHGRELESDSGISSEPDSSMEPRSRRDNAERMRGLTYQSILDEIRSMIMHIRSALALVQADHIVTIMPNGRTNSDSVDDDAQ